MGIKKRSQSWKSKCWLSSTCSIFDCLSYMIRVDKGFVCFLNKNALCPIQIKIMRNGWNYNKLYIFKLNSTMYTCRLAMHWWIQEFWKWGHDIWQFWNFTHFFFLICGKEKERGGPFSSLLNSSLQQLHVMSSLFNHWTTL
jgi:hypothetical protein